MTANRLGKIIELAMRQKTIPHRQSPALQPYYWHAEQFGFEKVEAYLTASHETRTSVLDLVSQSILRETQIIEEMGAAYAARMVSALSGRDEKIAYSIIGGEEATHYYAVSSFCKSECVDQEPPFAVAICELIQSADPLLLVFVLQVVLEGWALEHYKQLTHHCADPNLTSVLQMILRDEARHHGTGLVIHRQQNLSDRDRKLIVEILVGFLRMFQAGPQAAVGALDRGLGGLSVKAKSVVFTQMDATADSFYRLSKMKRLMLQAGEKQIVEQLERYSCFTPLTPDECAREQA